MISNYCHYYRVGKNPTVISVSTHTVTDNFLEALILSLHTQNNRTAVRACQQLVDGCPKGGVGNYFHEGYLPSHRLRDLKSVMPFCAAGVLTRRSRKRAGVINNLNNGCTQFPVPGPCYCACWLSDVSLRHLSGREAVINVIRNTCAFPVMTSQKMSAAENERWD